MKNIPKTHGYLIPHQLNIPITKGQESPRISEKYYYDGKG
jgi:hypothetical protein